MIACLNNSVAVSFISWTPGYYCLAGSKSFHGEVGIICELQKLATRQTPRHQGTPGPAARGLHSLVPSTKRPTSLILSYPWNGEIPSFPGQSTEAH